MLLEGDIGEADKVVALRRRLVPRKLTRGAQAALPTPQFLSVIVDVRLGQAAANLTNRTDTGLWITVILGFRTLIIMD
jgi:hypothetical protein